MGVVEIERKQLWDGAAKGRGVQNAKKAGAHEIGQRGSLAKPQSRGAPLSHKEENATAAAEILMPEEQFREHMDQHLGLAAVQSLASIFESSANSYTLHRPRL